MGSQPSSELFKDFENAVRNLTRAASPLIRRIGSNFKFLNQVFQAYVYTLLAHAARKNGIRISPQNVHGNEFVFKLATRGDPRRYSYFIIDRGGKRFSLLLNVNVRVGNVTQAWSRGNALLNLDISLIEGDSVSEPVNRGNIIFFIECKSVDNASPQYVATVIGQKLLVKRKLTKAKNHPYINITDLLAVRGKATPSTKIIAQMIKSRRWMLAVDVVDIIAPGQSGKREIERKITSLLSQL